MATASSAESGATALSVRPTVYVALGGTGMEVLLRLRRRILQADWNGTRLNGLEEFPAASFLYFDTDTVGGKESGRSGQTDPLARKVAFTEGEALQKRVNIERYQAERRNYPHIDEWLPNRDLSRIDTSKGAGQIRCISRLLFFDEYRNFTRLMTAKAGTVLSNMSNEASLRALGLATSADLRVVIIGSVAGGTGSGAFLDVGYAISSMETPKKPSTVDLFLVLPTGYIGANKERVFANGFAALSELEYCMRGKPSPPYVGRWGDYDQPSRYLERPFSDVYLFDSHNLADHKTANIGDLYDMMADILFEDFGNSEFAGRKRSIGVNQMQHKVRKWAPSLPAEFGRGSMTYSLNYSAMGQAIIATRGSLEFSAVTTRASLGMIEAFFGLVHGQEANRLPTVEERDGFLAERLALRPTAFGEFPEVIAASAGAIREFDLVNVLLRGDNEASIPDALALQIDEEINRIRVEVPEIRDWSKNVRKLGDAIETDILGRVGVGDGYGLRGREVGKARNRFAAGAVSATGPGSLKGELFRLLDDQKRGGITYTLALIEQVKDAIDLDGGAAATLDAAAADYARLADEMRATHFTASLDRLDQVRSGLFSSGRKDAERYLDQARADLRGYAVLRLRGVAATEAGDLVRRASAALGRQVGTDEARGKPRFDGMLGEFNTGRADVERLLGELRLELRQIDDAIKRGSGGTFLVLPSGSLQEIRLDPHGLLTWAQESFRAYGGSQVLFGLMRDDEKRGELLNAIRESAKRHLAEHETRIPTAVDALRELPPAQQREILARMVERSLPWIYANFDAFKPSADQYKMIIAVDGSAGFRGEFGPLIQAALPAQAGSGEVSFSESGVRGRIVCYCELSGIPLAVVAPLQRDWRMAYEQESNRTDAIPLHNHRDHLRFPDPVVPTTDEIETLRDTLGIFIRAVCLGLFVRDAGTGVYRFEFEPGDRRAIGTERTLRRKLLDPSQRGAIEARLNAVEGRLGLHQVMALAALYDWTARRAYAPRLETINVDAEARLGGIAHHVARDLALRWSRNARNMPGGGDEAAVAHAVELFGRTVEQWTEPLPGSLSDADSNEANRNPEDLPALRAVDKRTVVKHLFTEEILARLLDGGALQPAPANPWQPGTAPSNAPAPGGVNGHIHPMAAPPPPPPPPVPTFFVFLGGAVQGPLALDEIAAMVRTGSVSATTQVHPPGGAWAPAGTVPGIAAVLASRVPDPPAPPPPLFS